MIVPLELHIKILNIFLYVTVWVVSQESRTHPKSSLDLCLWLWETRFIWMYAFSNVKQCGCVLDQILFVFWDIWVVCVGRMTFDREGQTNFSSPDPSSYRGKCYVPSYYMIISWMGKWGDPAVLTDEYSVPSPSMQRNRVVAAPLMTTSPGSTGRISSRPAVQSLMWIKPSQHVDCPVQTSTEGHKSLTYCREFAPLNRGSVHPHQSAGEDLVWQSTGVWAGPPGPSRVQCVAPGPTEARRTPQQQTVCWWDREWVHAAAAAAWFIRFSLWALLSPADSQLLTLVLTQPF